MPIRNASFPPLSTVLLTLITKTTVLITKTSVPLIYISTGNTKRSQSETHFTSLTVAWATGKGVRNLHGNAIIIIITFFSWGLPSVRRPVSIFTLEESWTCSQFDSVHLLIFFNLTTLKIYTLLRPYRFHFAISQYNYMHRHIRNTIQSNRNVRLLWLAI